MTTWRFSANAGFFGLRRDRFVQYQPDRTQEEKFRLVAEIDGIDGIELKYPGEFEDCGRVRRLLEEHGLALSAVSVDLREIELFRYGALSARSELARRRAAGRLKEAMDLAADFGVDLVTTCPVADGHDYPFQVDHRSAWDHFIETVAEAASHRRDVRLSLEYQPHEPHAKLMLGTVGKLLYVLAEVGAPNLGANLDVGHSLAGGESPAEAAALLARGGRLFYIHTNDNTGDGGDWDMISGSVHLWHWLEFLYTLSRVGYDGWLGGDIVPKHFGPQEAYRTNLAMVRRMTALLERVGTDKITELLGEDGSAARALDYISSRLLPDADERAAE